ncbi:hypothetical protein INR49_008966, partial [Caranx melampygus]
MFCCRAGTEAATEPADSSPGGGVAVSRDTGDTAGSLLQPAMHLPGSGSLAPPTVAPNGQAGPKEQGEFVGLFESAQHHGLCEGSDMKEGKMIRLQKQQQHQDVGMFQLEDNVSLLNQSISDLNRTSGSVISSSDTSVLGNLPLPDLFPPHIKQEQGSFSLEKDLGTFGAHTGPSPCDLDANSSRLLEDTEIWQGLDLPTSLPEISDFELDSEVAHLDNILHDSSGVGGPEEVKSLVGNGGNCTSVNGTDQQHPMHHHHQQQQLQQHHHLLQHQQQQQQQQQQQHPLHHQHQQQPTLLSTVMIKEEKDPDDSFTHIRTPGVVKQEKQDGAGFCQSQCLQSSMGTLHGGPMSSPMGIGAGPGFLFKASPSSAVGQQDQKPFACSQTCLQWGRAGPGATGMERRLGYRGLTMGSPPPQPWLLSLSASP